MSRTNVVASIQAIVVLGGALALVIFVPEQFLEEVGMAFGLVGLASFLVLVFLFAD